MNRRDFFEWIGKAASAIGLGYLAFNSGIADAVPGPQRQIKSAAPPKPRMNASACRDFRMISADQSIFLDKDIFKA